jgi:membrane protease YdiL (CAAX protease family)
MISSSVMKTTLKYFKPIAMLCLAALSCALFTGFTPPIFDPAQLDLFADRGFSADQITYWWRFGLSSLLLGALPLAAMLLLGNKPSSLGLTTGAKAMKSKAFIVAMPIALAIGIIGGLSPELASYYPYASDLHKLVRTNGLGPLAGHLSAYLVFYYLPWEFFFRGFLLIPFVEAIETLKAAASPSDGARASQPAYSMALGFAIFSQTIASTMLHFGHPITELITAIPAGIVFGWLAYRSRSIVPGLILHALVGFGTDSIIVLNRAGII